MQTVQVQPRTYVVRAPLNSDGVRVLVSRGFVKGAAAALIDDVGKGAVVLLGFKQDVSALAANEVD